MADHLDTYRAKRDFTKTSEPQGGATRGEKPTFVVQKHQARALHYDVRFEVDGVMPSWAVPKGPAYDPRVKRLAMHVEDHPLDYQDFEGGIPKGEYGGGRVIVWDRGTYRNITDKNGRAVPMREAIDSGHVSVWIDGTKLHGGWSLTRTGRGRDGKDSWIMVKRKDEFAAPDLDITGDYPDSVISGRPLEAIGQDDRQWTRARATWTPPMLAELVKAAPSDIENWQFERKLDGLRAIAVRNGDEVELWSRNRLSYTGRFPGIVAAIGALAVDNVTLDGEIVAFDGDATSFELLQRPGSAARPVLVVFDVLHLLGNDTTALPQQDRSALVSQIIDDSADGTVRVSRRLDGAVDGLMVRAKAERWEGLIAKRVDAPYTAGRSRAWQKLKVDARQELVIGGWTDPRGTREHLGAILVGYYDDAGALHYAGKVGSGFDHPTLDLLHEQLIERPTSPFADAPRMRDAHWAEPLLVGNVTFSEWTKDGKLRHPRFQGLRVDKAPGDVRRERPA